MHFSEILWGPDKIKEKVVICHPVPTWVKGIECLYQHIDTQIITQCNPKLK